MFRRDKALLKCRSRIAAPQNKGSRPVARHCQVTAGSLNARFGARLCYAYRPAGRGRVIPPSPTRRRDGCHPPASRKRTRRDALKVDVGPVDAMRNRCQHIAGSFGWPAASGRLASREGPWRAWCRVGRLTAWSRQALAVKADERASRPCAFDRPCWSCRINPLSPSLPPSRESAPQFRAEWRNA